MALSSYVSSYAIGHKAVESLWDGPVVVQEKIDGSQISFGVDARDGALHARSRRNEIMLRDPDGMFAAGIQTITFLADAGLLVPGWTYRGEYLQKPRHVTLSYSRIPKRHIILFDVDKGEQDYLTPEELAAHAEMIGLECVPHIATYTEKPELDVLKVHLERESVLGGVKVEGIVLKCYTQFTLEKKIMLAKLVRDDFKEQATIEWRRQNPARGDVIQQIIDAYATEARWMKAVQHLREQGQITGAPQDIPLVLQEIVADVKQEEGDAIRDVLFAHFWRDIQRGLTRGAPEWYKRLLAEEQFGEGDA